MQDSTIVHEVTNDIFEGLLSQYEIIFVDFWTQRCAPCKQFADIYEQAAREYPTIFFGKINIEVEEELSELFQIQSVPHLIVFKQGIAIYSESGSMPLSTLKELADQAIVVDVSDIRAQIRD